MTPNFAVGSSHVRTAAVFHPAASARAFAASTAGRLVRASSASASMKAGEITIALVATGSTANNGPP
jgi:hypothetical protein